MKVVLLSIFVIFLVVSCNFPEKDVECSPVPSFVYIHLIGMDSVSLIGYNKLYHPDSIKFIINQSFIKTRIDSIYLTLNTTNLDTLSNKDFYLYLNQADTDTIRLKVTKSKSECGTFFGIDEFRYNGELVVQSSNRFCIIKK